MQLCLADRSLKNTCLIKLNDEVQVDDNWGSQEGGLTVNTMWAMWLQAHRKPDIDFLSNVSIRACIWQRQAAS